MSEMKIAWRDASSYSRGERGTVEPTAWEIVSASPGRMRVCVHRVHRLEGWFVTCHELRIDRRELGDVTLDEAKMSALKLVAQHARAEWSQTDRTNRLAFAMRHLAALLPAEVLPPIDKDDERTVDALVAAKTGQARRLVTHAEKAEDDGYRLECESCVTIAPRSAMYLDEEGLAFCANCMANEFRVAMEALGLGDAFEGDTIEVCTRLREEMDAALARADAAEKRVAELEPYRAKVEAWRSQWGFRCVACGKLDNDVTRCDACAHAAGIREGLERAAAWCEESRAAGKLAKGLCAMKEQVK